jgi:hypothetical protein
MTGGTAMPTNIRESSISDEGNPQGICEFTGGILASNSNHRLWENSWPSYAFSPNQETDSTLILKRPAQSITRESTCCITPTSSIRLLDSHRSHSGRYLARQTELCLEPRRSLCVSSHPPDIIRPQRESASIERSQAVILNSSNYSAHSRPSRISLRSTWKVCLEIDDVSDVNISSIHTKHEEMRGNW